MRIPRIPTLPILLVAIAMALAPSVMAESVVVNGIDGVAGARGPDGNPGQPGQPGADAPAVHALADASSEDNRAEARGGDGGRGGAGGNGWPPGTGASGGDGADGGRGADATAEALGSDASSVTALAFAGRGGLGGNGGRRTTTGPGGINGSDGAPGMGGAGGDARAIATLSTDRATPVDGRVDSWAGGASRNAGGDAAATLTITNSGTGRVDAATSGRGARAIGGDGGSADFSGGDATAATTVTGGGAVHARAEALGGRASGAGNGGSAIATARATGSGTGDVSVTAIASARDSSSSLGVGGSATAQAHGSSAGGGDVTVIARQNAGGENVIRDAVSGSTSGLLTLEQRASAGFESDRSVGVRTSLVASNPGGGDLSIVVSASGPTSAIVESASATADGAVDVSAVASGTTGASCCAGQNGGVAEVLSAFGRSTGNQAVSVRAEARGGDGRSIAGAVAGADATLIDVVDAVTAGPIFLEQRAIGGDANGGVGTAGNAVNSLTTVKAADSLAVRVESVGGDAPGAPAAPGVGGTADAAADATNTQGDVHVQVLADGGRAASSFFQTSVDGGKATAHASGTTSGDGHAVHVGGERTYGAIGGLAIGSQRTGGDAVSTSVGTALGDSLVVVLDGAQGGLAINGANGGTATSTAQGGNAGASSVEVRSRATGGDGGLAEQPSNRGGDGGTASAVARGVSTGGADVIVEASATGGDGGGGIRSADSGSGADVILDNSVSGSTTGNLTLQLSGVGGRGGNALDGVGGRGGNAHAALDRTNEGGGALTIDVRLVGGVGGRGGIRSGDGGEATLGPIVGRSSNGGDVTIFADVRGGVGAGSQSGGVAGRGASVSLINALSGETSGAISLRQVARAGSGSAPALDGSATSELSQVSDSTSLSVITEAVSSAGASAMSSAENASGSASGAANAIGSHASAAADAHGRGDAAVSASADGRSRTAGGTARARASAVSDGAGATTAVARASGANSTVSDADGGSADAHAFASNAGAGDVDAFAWARSGAGRGTGSAGTALVSAEGHSTGGGDVTVEAQLQVAPGIADDIVLRDAVHGSTTGRLELRQVLEFAPEVFGAAGTGRDALTSLVAQNAGGGDLALDVRVTAGAGAGARDGGDAVVGDVIATSTTGADVEISVSAAGGAGGLDPVVNPAGGTVLLENRDGAGGSTPSRIHGESNGGRVSVSTLFRGGDGGRHAGFDALPGGSGTSIDRTNVASADTAGDLNIEQSIVGGRGGLGGVLGGRAGAGGHAASRLSKRTTSTSLRLVSLATGGDSDGGDSGSALATVDAFNHGGTAIAVAGATGGRDRLGVGTGGDATVDVRAKTYRDGDAVVVGEPAGAASYGALGGRAERLAFGPQDSLFGSGGEASSRSIGRALGNATVDVHDLAVGGAGARGALPAFGGDGGAASSIAEASGGGDSRVLANADATGGSGARGGGASAVASAIGYGRVESTARALGGDTSGVGPALGSAGAALAQASARGATGFAQADAATGMGSHHQVRAASGATLSGQADVKSRAAVSTPLSELARGSSLDGASLMTVAPLDGDVAAALAGNDALAEAFALDGGAEMLALGAWQGTGREGNGAPTVLTTELDLVLDDTDPARRLVLAAFDLGVAGTSFLDFSFQLEKIGEGLVAHEVFDSPEAVAAYFADTVLDLGRGVLGGAGARARFSITLSDTSRFQMGVAFARVIPEPSTGTLMLIGLALLATRRRGV